MLKKFILLISICTISFSAGNIGTITTGTEDGTYIQIGKDISTLFKKYDVELQVVESEGSLDNIRRITGLDKLQQSNWAIVQRDVLKYYKYKYYKETKQSLNAKVKIVLPLYDEEVHIFTKKGKTIKFELNENIKVGVKSEKSGGYITAKVIANSYGVEFNFLYCDFDTAKEYLQKGVIDIFIDVTAKPNSSYKNLEDIDFVELPDTKVMDKNYKKTVFTRNDYPWLEKNMTGYSCPSILVKSLIETRYDKVISFFIEALLQNSKELKNKGHARWNEIYENLELNSKNYNYHPQVIQSVSSYKKEL